MPLVLSANFSLSFTPGIYTGTTIYTLQVLLIQLLGAQQLQMSYVLGMYLSAGAMKVCS